jgi:hypothetical protein
MQILMGSYCVFLQWPWRFWDFLTTTFFRYSAIMLRGHTGATSSTVEEIVSLHVVAQVSTGSNKQASDADPASASPLG